MRRACAFLLLALVCAGCGDDKKESGPTAPAFPDEKKAAPDKGKAGPGFSRAPAAAPDGRT